jgi:carboxyl-terminal processing protease
LTASHTERSKEDPNFQYQVDMIRAAEEVRSQKAISLNIDDRRAEREADLQKRLKRENDRRKALNLEPLASLDDIEVDDLPDVLLDQAAGIVADMATIRQIPSSPERTAQVKP